MKRTNSQRFIPHLEAAFLKQAIESGTNDRAKRALQTLCKHYWNGGKLLPSDQNGTENTILGALTRSNSDEKVRRWSLSALAQLGRPRVSWDAVIGIIQRHQSEPQVVSAGIAAAFKMNTEKARTVLTQLSLVSPQFLVISALQTTSSENLEDTNFLINVDEADATTLKLSLILVGLNRAPSNLFHPRYENAELIRDLGTHQDPLVSQYSLWAAAENPHLSAKHVGIDPLSIENREPNIRSYMYRLYASEQVYSDTQHQLIEAGSRDDDVEAQMGCAIGIRNTWYDGIENIILDWLHDEDNFEIQKYLLDHIARQAIKSPGYWSSAIELFSAYESMPEMRNILLAGAEKTPLFSELKKMEMEDKGLFANGDTYNMTNNNISNSGNMQGQFSASGSGNSGNSGDQSSFSIGDINTDNAILAIKAAHEEIKNSELTPELREEALRDLRDAESNPGQENIERALKAIERCRNVMSNVTGMIEKGKKLAGYAASLAAAAGI